MPNLACALAYSDKGLRSFWLPRFGLTRGSVLPCLFSYALNKEGSWGFKRGIEFLITPP
jgi:hypothetical protein